MTILKDSFVTPFPFSRMTLHFGVLARGSAPGKRRWTAWRFAGVKCIYKRQRRKSYLLVLFFWELQFLLGELYEVVVYSLFLILSLA
jgi:hypothetical protein